MSDDEKIKEYIGKTIKEFKFGEKKLEFSFSDGVELVLYAQGDCCSESWFEGIYGEYALSPGSVLTSMEFVDLQRITKPNKEDEHFDDDCVRLYGVKIMTSVGYADIDMRNSSNGYYGGFITVNVDDQCSWDNEWDPEV